MMKSVIYMKKLLAILILNCILASLLFGCAPQSQPAQIAATTLPVYCFTSELCQGTPLQVARLVTESVSCLHDYTLQTKQMRAIEAAQVIVISGAGLEEFLEDALAGQHLIDASLGLSLLEGEHDHEQEHENGHVHEEDPHIWLSPANACVMAKNICDALCGQYPAYEADFRSNLANLLDRLHALQAYGEEALGELSCREIITFHDGFSYLAESFGLEVIHAVEEESGSEASAAELIELVGVVREHQLPAVFTERNGADAAAKIVASETGAKIYMLDMVMSGEDYFTAMYHNIDTLKEALG